ncbi:heterokaryon incompatibility protein-domain-containing protein [Nemania sp. FL0916]|nr:heterokaryon incompatibility protein-domain-containing protein [Nemania sp. FL0916]
MPVMANTQLYYHQPLCSARSIRVIHLQPSISSKAPLQCILSELDLDSLAFPAPYEALSYVWGGRVGTVPVICHDKQLLVTPNCRDALLCLRKRRETRCLFIDAICIDQREEDSSRKEREQQIKLMGLTYAKAARVNIWLGPSRKQTGKLFKLMKIMHLNDTPVDDFFAHPGPLHAVAKRIISIHDAIRSGPSTLEEEFIQLASYPWFMRSVCLPCISMLSLCQQTWTMQEQILADENACAVLCGEHQIQYEVFQSAFSTLDDIWNFAYETIENLESRISLKYQLTQASQTKSTTSYEHYLSQAYFWLGTRNLNATVPQDKIFGIYSLLTQMGIEMPEPDYAMSEFDLYENATRAIIQATGSLNLLSFCIRQDSHHTLPSWVPDWSTKIITKWFPDMGGFSFFDTPAYRATKDAHVNQQQVIQQGKLTLQGVIIGNIEFISGPSYIEDLKGRTLPLYYAFAEACRKWCQCVASSSPNPDVLDSAHRTLFFSHYGYRPDTEAKESNGHFESFSSWFDLMLYPDCATHDVADLKTRADKYRQSGDTASWDPHMDPSVELISLMLQIYLDREDEFAHALTDASNYALMILDTGRFARGFHLCAQHDVVALLAGCKFPVALRPNGNGGYRYVAPLYVDGIMFGEAWPENESELVDIVLV